MRRFMDKDFLLTTPTAERLFTDYAKGLPIIDYHCHINPKEIAEDKRFENITRIWLGGDHYKWRLMRSAGVEERFITGGASDREKFQKWAETLDRAIGNPLYHWSHLELKRYFGYDGILNGSTAEEVWQLCEKKLAEPEMNAKGLITASNVEVLCTTDDPIDSLEWHRAIATDKGFSARVLPAWRPDRAMNIEKFGFCDYVEALSEASGVRISSFAGLKTALHRRMDFFSDNGCRLSDHGLDKVVYAPVSDVKIEEIFAKRMGGSELSDDETKSYKTMFMLFCGRECAERGWTMQLHYGCKRDNNGAAFERLGADTGFDCIGSASSIAELADFLDCLERTDSLPRTIIYSLNPSDNQAIDTVIGCFQGSETVSKIQHGAAWWFNDCKSGIRDHLISLGNLGYLAGFVGMLTDSRSFLSYPRHEYFRRILCGLLGEMVEGGEFPADFDTLGGIVSDISYGNAKRYFGF